MHEHVATADAIEPGHHRWARVATQFIEILLIGLVALRTEQHSAEAMQRHAIDVEGSHAGWRGHIDSPWRLIDEPPQQRALAGASHAGQENVATAVRVRQESRLFGNRCAHLREFFGRPAARPRWQLDLPVSLKCFQERGLSHFCVFSVELQHDA